MFSRPIRLRLAGAGALGLTLTISALAGVTSASAATVTPGSVLSASRTAIADQTSAHVVFAARSKATSTKETLVADVSGAGGIETVSEGSGVLHVRVTPAFAYLSGNPYGLTNVFGLSSSSAKKIGKHWVSWKAGSSQYRSFKSDLTLSSITGLLPAAAGTSLRLATLGGLRVYILKWTTPAADTVPKLSTTLTISASGVALPLTRKSTGAGGTIVSTNVSGWGEKVIVRAPAASDVIPSSKIGA